MRLCEKNKRDVWYSYFKGENDVLDENYDFTGEFEKLYTNPFKTKANFNVTNNRNINTEVGNIVGADLIIITNEPIFNLETILWTYEPDNLNYADTYEYKVFKIIPSLNGTFIVGLKARS